MSDCPARVRIDYQANGGQQGYVYMDVVEFLSRCAIHHASMVDSVLDGMVQDYLDKNNCWDWLI